MLRKVNNYCIFVGSEWKPPLIKPELEVIEFVLFGLDLLEPNVLITDALLGLLSALFALKISRLSAEHTFFKRWQLFLLMFGIGTFLGGIGHAFYNYLDLAGKVPSWIFATFSVYFIEQSMLSIYPHRRRLKLLRQISGYKLAAVMIILGVLLTLSHPDRKIDYCMLAVILNSFIGVSLSAGLLGNYYYRLGYSSYFRYFVTGFLIMVPASAVFLFEVNLHRWFDRNDLSHVILGIGITYFYFGVLNIFKEEHIV